MKICLVYVTNENELKANQLAKKVINARLAACANLFPIESAYWWQGAIENDNEVVTLFKTTEDQWIPLRDKIQEIHPYEVPCIMKIDVTVNDSYSNWIKESVS